jgi:hypothetical protein
MSWLAFSTAPKSNKPAQPTLSAIRDLGLVGYLVMDQTLLKSRASVLLKGIHLLIINDANENNTESLPSWPAAIPLVLVGHVLAGILQ